MTEPKPGDRATCKNCCKPIVYVMLSVSRQDAEINVPYPR